MASEFSGLAVVTMEELFAGRITSREAKAQLRVSAQIAFEIEMTNRMSLMKRSLGNVSAYDHTDECLNDNKSAGSRKAGRASKENL